ncbi:unnamed protein product [Durusdinium trenchii]|uniref:Uncharacterized protein n=1 Tax=Durusdinium trenchii TaxID=1381693 RepID=A0ABP0Q5R6_9DINO
MQQDLGEESATATGPQLLNPPFVHSLAYLPDETLAAGLGDGTVALLEERRPSARLRGGLVKFPEEVYSDVCHPFSWSGPHCGK